MPLARIYRPTKNAMQSGQAEEPWLLEFVPNTPYVVDPLMGWSGMDDTTRQLRLRFASMEAAIEYAKKHHIAYELVLPNPAKRQKKAYADNFAFKKVKR